MQKFDTFYIEKFDFDIHTGVAEFQYSFDKEVFFVEKIGFYAAGFMPSNNISLDTLSTFLFPLSIALAISYYKLYPTEKLIVESGYLSQEDMEFWKKFFLNGLGEFFYTNKISPTGLCNFVSISGKRYLKAEFLPQERVLLPLGGGKDSIVSSLVLEKTGVDYTHFVFGKMDTIKQNVADISGKKILFISRSLAPELFQMNNQGYYNGHVPITGIISFVTLIVSYIYEYKYIAISNEKSASEENTILEGVKINHQYSKSFEFEKDFREYVGRNINSQVQYFSLLRSLYEVQIAKIFAYFGKKYFQVFSSCNKNFKISGTQNGQKYWCNNCPKCLFAYSIIRPYISSQEVKGIWGEELYDKIQLKDIFLGLVSTQALKPFECVGEKRETRYAVDMFGKKQDFSRELLKIYTQQVSPSDKNDILTYQDVDTSENFSPKIFQDSLVKLYEETKFCG